MVNSKISVIWLNYNSKKFLSLALASLNSMFNMDVENFEIIIVDNASTDGSFESIVKFVNSKGRMRHKVRIIRSDKNRGYSGGMNLGWEARDHDSKYVAFLNNDLIADTVSLREIVERMDAEPDVGAASGLIHFGDGRTIFSAGASLPNCGIRGEYATALPSLSATEGGELATSPTPMALIWWRE